ncbi:hypothetical protein G6549_24530 [Bacillus sp. MM2020_1]|nr:hypothetical protein [Bacillus sp. MM2020_1]
MNISDNLTQQKLLEILIETYIRVQEKENLQMFELLEEIKQKVLSEINTNDY